MTMTPHLRKAMLTAHVAASVGWIGAVAASLVLAITGLTSQDTHMVRAVYLTMEPIGWYVLVPLSIASLLTGLLQSLGTRWGLLRHYWVLITLLMNVFATTILLLYTQTLGYLADVAAKTPFTSDDLHKLRDPSPVVHGGAALLLLLVATALSVYKPQGMTRYGRRKQHQQRAEASTREHARSQP